MYSFKETVQSLVGFAAGLAIAWLLTSIVIEDARSSQQAPQRPQSEQPSRLCICPNGD